MDDRMSVADSESADLSRLPRLRRRQFFGAATAAATTSLVAGALAAPRASAAPAGREPVAVPPRAPDLATSPVPAAVPSPEVIAYPPAAYASAPTDPGVLNVKTLFGAAGDGVTDDTAAIIAAIDAVEKEVRDSVPNEGTYHPGANSTQKIIYFPKGTYLVSDTLVYSFTFFERSPNTSLEGHTSLRLRGESQTETTIKLADGAPGFGTGERKPVLCWGKAPLERANPHNNTVGSNFLENLTIDTGSGNPGAIGAILTGSNCNAVRHVTIRSGDGAGAAGLDLYVGGTQWYGYNIDIHGFDVGLRFAATYASCSSFERLSLYDQNVRAAEVADGSIALYHLRTEGAVPGLLVDGDSAMATVLDCAMITQTPGLSAIELQEGVLYARNVQVEGFATGISREGTAVAHGDVERFVSTEVTAAFPEARAPLTLPIMPSPTFVWPDPATWTSVADFGAVGDATEAGGGEDGTDNTQALNDAFASGAETLWFPPGQYRISGRVTIPGTVKRINFMYCRIVVDPALIQPLGTPVADELPVFDIRGNGTDEPLLIEDLYTRPLPSADGAYRVFKHMSDRTVVLSDIHLQQGPVYKNGLVPGGEVYFENVASRTASGLGNPAFVLNGGKQAWARHINPENGHPEILLRDHSSMWILSLKKQADGTLLEVTDGAQAELLSAIVVSIPEIPVGRPLLRCVDSSIGASLATRTSPVDLDYWNRVIHETRGGVDGYVFHDDLPPRGTASLADYQRFLPMYVARS
ncbi:hypothetical protein IM660_03765 [Ruania alkalisoli]|uniref:Rhamnogalacturonase A/B/Epimerase-like pectate lyase domain-containing protein n=1 Tax=Ruania alkalisoli TaxID=2779775 RepID=A0A7M1SV16_9MICO|nr:glycosyl hydrolase family 28-related protein [Ruania alkalisoli]QOR71426.1 hypothetical protein IM660_03765 [Ruania alkalisoli]